MKLLTKLPFFFLLLSLAFTSCEEDDDDLVVTPDAGTITGGPFTFVIDGTPDMVSGIASDPDAVGSNASWVITDDAGNILGLPPTLADLESVDFDGAGTGVCLIWYIRYEDGLSGLVAGENANDLSGDFDLSNSIMVTRNGLNAGTISGGPFTFTVDGVSDMVSGITLDDSEVDGANTSWIITDPDGNILGLPPTLEDVQMVDFDGAGPGVCLIWHATFSDGLTGLEIGNNVADLVGFYGLSNSISVTREALNGGSIDGGPFTFTVDGFADMVSGITLDDSEVNGMNTGWIITDPDANILGLPATLEDVEGVNFDGAGPGVCLIWHATFSNGLEGLEVGNNVADLVGFYALSNSISVTREALNAGMIEGGPFNFIIDGEADMVSGITLDDSEVNGMNTGWIITDPDANILGLPPTLADVEMVDFNGAGAGVCLIWHATFSDGLEGLEVGNNVADLVGFYAISNSITVNRKDLNAGSIAGGPFEILIDGTPDMVDGITLDDSELVGDNTSWVITDPDGNILGVPATLEDVEGIDFDGAGIGTCLIWHIAYSDGLQGLETGMTVADLDGFYDLSNSITVERVGPQYE